MNQQKNKFRGWCYALTLVLSRFASVLFVSTDNTFEEKIAFGVIIVLAIALMNHAMWKKGISQEYDYPYIKKRKNIYLAFVVIFILFTILSINSLITDIAHLNHQGYNVSISTLSLEFYLSLAFSLFGNLYIIIVMYKNYRLSKRLRAEEANNLKVEKQTEATDIDEQDIDSKSLIEKEEANCSEKPDKNLMPTNNVEPVVKNNDDNQIIKFCRICGTKLNEGSSYCHNCGTKVKE